MCEIKKKVSGIWVHSSREFRRRLGRCCGEICLNNKICSLQQISEQCNYSEIIFIVSTYLHGKMDYYYHYCRAQQPNTKSLRMKPFTSVIFLPSVCLFLSPHFHSFPFIPHYPCFDGKEARKKRNYSQHRMVFDCRHRFKFKICFI